MKTDKGVNLLSSFVLFILYCSFFSLCSARANHNTRERSDLILISTHRFPFPRLLAFWHMNPRVLNEKLVRFLEEVVENEMDFALHGFDNLQIIYSIAIGEWRRFMFYDAAKLRKEKTRNVSNHAFSLRR